MSVDEYVICKMFCSFQKSYLKGKKGEKRKRKYYILPVFLHTVRCYPGTACAAPDVFGPAAFAAVSPDRRLIWTRAVLSNRPRLIEGIRDFPSALYLWVLLWSWMARLVLKMWTGVWSSMPGFQDPFCFWALSSRLVLNVAYFPRDVHGAHCHLMLLYLLLLVFILYECHFSLCLF